MTPNQTHPGHENKTHNEPTLPDMQITSVQMTGKKCSKQGRIYHSPKDELKNTNNRTKVHVHSEKTERQETRTKPQTQWIQRTLDQNIQTQNTNKKNHEAINYKSKRTRTITTVNTYQIQARPQEIKTTHKPKPKNTLRIYTQNVNGIPTSNSEIHFQTMIQIMLEKQVDIFGWSEKNLEWNNFTLQHNCYKMIRRHMPGGAWKPTTSRIPMQSNQKHGGNLMAMVKPLRARAQVLEKDTMGRWVWTVIRGKSKLVLIIQLYVPASNQGLLSTYAQQYQQIQEDTGQANPNVYDTFFKDLHALIEKHPNMHKIVMGDYNRPTEDEDISHLQATYNLRDIYADIHDYKEFNTHKRGSRRIDYILVSAELTPFIQNIEYEEFDQGI